MEASVNLDKAYAPSAEVVAREIEGELILVPLTAGIGDMEDELYTLNETGRAIWKRLGQQTTLRSLVDSLADKYRADPREIEEDVLGLVGELVKRKLVVEVRY
jgi:hypothetical protein